MMYGGPDAIAEFDDRTLAHLRAAIVDKLKRSEPFALHFSNQGRGAAGHTVLWLHPAIPLRFHFAGRTGPLNRAWVEAMLDSANNASGLMLVEEPMQAPDDRRRRAAEH
ncbi:hypothetical protein B7R54_18260 [Subtercola boreus]|uniref:DUF7882 domain-containing protein n=2 Tax=Subtercola boreus TaxID=120213 RepID=A0A3E0VMM8_9MICO|nr:hypothetical protein [Subtercola boreus]RFA10935.1 hypothetical protein B7R54_18260 [Subtercola boreus]